MDSGLSYHRHVEKLCCAFGLALYLQNVSALQPATPTDTARAGGSLSFGGEVRERFEYYSNPNFSLQGQQADNYLLHRILLHADLNANDYIRVFVQLGNHLAPWKDSAAPPHLDRLDPHQAFVDVRLPLTSAVEGDPILRIGRQEMFFGSQRLVAVRDAPNVRRNFDGFRLTGTIESARVDAFVTRPVQLRKGAFDDGLGRSQAFWGVYTTAPVGFARSAYLDLYYLGFNNERAIFASAVGEEHRHTIGMRFFGTAAGLDWDWEALGQFGTLAQRDIRAWSVATDTGYTFETAGWKVRAGLKANIASGDRNPSDSTLGTINPLFPKLAYFNAAALLGPSNLMDIHPTLSITPVPEFTVVIGYDFVWRATTADAIYTGTGLPIPNTAGRAGKLSGRQLSVDLSWSIGRRTQLGLGYVHFDAANVMKLAGGHDVDFVFLSAAYRF